MKYSSNASNTASDKPKVYPTEKVLSKMDEEVNPLNFSEVKDIQKDLLALKDDIAKLSTHVYNDGGKQLKQFAEEKMQLVEDKIQKRPAQTLAIAFMSGIALSFLLGRR